MLLGREFVFLFSHATRVDVAVGVYGEGGADVELEVFDQQGERRLARHFLEVPQGGAITTRDDTKSDNLARYVGPSEPGLVVVRGSRQALLAVSSLCIGKGLTSCSVLHPVPGACGTTLLLPIAIGLRFHLLLTSPHPGEAMVEVEVGTAEGFRPLQPALPVGYRQVRITEDAFGMGKPAVLRATSVNGRPIIAWGLGIGRSRSELYPIPA